MTDDFWDWLPKAYGEVGDEPSFTKYNMEVAFAAGAEAEAKRMWVDLTDEEIIDVIHPSVMADMPDEATDYEIARAIEAKLRSKNT